MEADTPLKEFGQRRDEECPKPLGTQLLAWHPGDTVIQPCPGDSLDGTQSASEVPGSRPEAGPAVLV